MMLPSLLRASIEGAAVAAVVWSATRAVRRLSPAVRATLWWAATAKFVIALAWVTPFVIPILPPGTVAAGSRAAAHVTTSLAPIFEAADEPSVGALPFSQPTWRGALVPLWAAGVLVTAAVALRRCQRTAAVVCRAKPAAAELRARVGDLVTRLRLRRIPRVLVSDEVDAPMAAGLWRPLVLLPASRFASLTAQQQDMVLCHELAHIKRHDLWFGCVPALAERLFFFHPLARLAAREYAVAREAACDAAVLELLGAAPQEYARLLLDLGVSRSRPVLVASGTAWSASNLKRRISMLMHSTDRSLRARLAAGAATGVALIGLLPVHIGARPPHEAKTMGTASEASSAQDRSQQGSKDRNRESLNFIFFRGGDDVTMSGSTDDLDRARRMRKGDERLLVFRNRGQEYVVRDSAVLDQFVTIWAPVEAIGAKQGAVGGRQGDIGRAQAGIGAKQAEVGIAQARIGERQSQIASRHARLAATAARSDEGRTSVERDRLDDDMRDLDREMRSLDAKMRELDTPMRELDEKMRELDAEMRVLDGQMREAEKRAQGEMRTLVERAIASRAAQPVR